jgi:hypothetical protein
MVLAPKKRKKKKNRNIDQGNKIESPEINKKKKKKLI